MFNSRRVVENSDTSHLTEKHRNEEAVNLKTPYAILCVVLYLLTMAILVFSYEMIKPTLFVETYKPT